MKSIFSLFMFLWLSAFYSSSFATNNNIAYLHKIYDAEDAIIDSKYERALAIYLEAFELKKEKIFTEDLFNALKCALLTKEIEQSWVMAEKLAKTGVGGVFMKKHFERTLSILDERRFELVCNAAAASKAYFAQMNDLLLDTLQKLYDEDQYFHTLWLEKQRKGINIDSIHQDSIYVLMSKEDTRLSKSLKAIYDEGHTLSEFELGAYVEGDSSLVNARGFTIIILHNYQGFENADTLFSSILKSQIEQGDIKPIYLANLSDQNSTPLKDDYGCSTGGLICKDNSIYFGRNTYQSGLHHEKIERNRKKIYLDSMKSQLRKVMFMHTANPEKFSFSIPRCLTHANVNASIYELAK